MRPDRDTLEHRRVRGDPAVVADPDRGALLQVLVVEVVLIGVEDTTAVADPDTAPEHHLALRAQLTRVEQAVRPHRDSSPFEGNQMDLAQLGPQPDVRAELDLGARLQMKVQPTGQPLGDDPRTDPEPGTRRQCEARTRQIAAGGGIDLEARVPRALAREAQSVPEMDGAKPDGGGPIPHEISSARG